MTKIISIYNRKGGVGKTITSFNLAWYLRAKGYTVLCLDLDPQANLSISLLEGKSPVNKISDFLIEGIPIRHENISHRTFKNGYQIDFIPASVGLCRIESRLPEGTVKEFCICDVISEIKEDYDFILFDLPPGGEALSFAALVASTDVLIPTSPTSLGCEGVIQTLQLISTIQKNVRLNPELNDPKILITLKDPRKILTENETERKLRENKYDVVVLNQVIHRGNLVEKALERHEPILAFAPDYYVASDYTNAFEELTNTIAE